MKSSDKLVGSCLKKIAVLAVLQIYEKPIRDIFESESIDIAFFSDFEDLQSSLSSGAEFDVVFIPHFRSLIPDNFLSDHVCVGFHTGNLPNDRGGSPIQNKILRTEYKSEVSSIVLNKTIDGGDILVSSPIDLEFGNIEEILKNVANIVAEQIHKISLCFPHGKSQINLPTRFKRLGVEDSTLKTQNVSLKSIYDQIRMLDGFDYPKANLNLQNIRIEFYDATLATSGKYLDTRCKIEVINEN